MASFDFAPGLANLSSYKPAWLRHDLVAGLVLTALLVPQGMAYAELAGLPPITGLYTSIMCLLAYAVFGPSRILVLGQDSALGPMIAATILPLVAADGDPAKAVALVVGQLPKLFGFSIDSDNFLGDLTGFVRGVADGKTVGAALAVGVGGV